MEKGGSRKRGGLVHLTPRRFPLLLLRPPISLHLRIAHFPRLLVHLVVERWLRALYPEGEALLRVGDYDFFGFLGLRISLRVRRREFGGGEGGLCDDLVRGGFGEGFGG